MLLFLEHRLASFLCYCLVNKAWTFQTCGLCGLYCNYSISAMEVGGSLRQYAIKEEPRQVGLQGLSADPVSGVTPKKPVLDAGAESGSSSKSLSTFWSGYFKFSYISGYGRFFYEQSCFPLGITPRTCLSISYWGFNLKLINDIHTV